MQQPGPQLLHLDIGRIEIRRRVRSDLGDLAILEDSIRKLGLLFPILVDQNHVLLSGLRRLEACRRLGLRQVPVLVAQLPSNTSILDVECQENVCRKDLPPAEIDCEIEMKKLSSLKQAQAGQGIWKRLTRILRKPKTQTNPGVDYESGI